MRFNFCGNREKLTFLSLQEKHLYERITEKIYVTYLLLTKFGTWVTQETLSYQKRVIWMRMTVQRFIMIVFVVVVVVIRLLCSHGELKPNFWILVGAHEFFRVSLPNVSIRTLLC